MNITIRKALKVLKNFGLLYNIPDFYKIKKIIHRENIIFCRFPFKGRLKERYICTPDNIAVITINEGVSSCELKHLTAHALGHHFLHKGNHAFVNNAILDKQENQAEEFAAIILVPPPALIKIKPVSIYELAGECDIPIDLAERRMRIFKRHGV